MCTSNAQFISTHIFDPDAGPVSNPIFHFITTFMWKAWINRSNTVQPGGVIQQNLSYWLIIRVIIQRQRQRTASIKLCGPFNAHTLDIELRTFMLADRVASSQESMKVGVPDPILFQLFMIRKVVQCWIKCKLKWIIAHIMSNSM